MAIGLTRSKNLSESNLNLKTALQKLYAPGIENDIELFSLSSSVESICFSGAPTDENVQIFRLTTEKLRTISGEVINRTKFNSRYFTFTDENKIYFTKYTLGVGGGEGVSAPRFSVNGSIPTIDLLSGGGGFYFLDSQNEVPQLENFSGTWAASSSNVITITLSEHGFIEGQVVALRFDASGGGTNATDGEYVIVSVPEPGSFTVLNAGGSILGSGNVEIRSFDVRVQNVRLRGSVSGSTNARARVTFTKQSFDYLRGVNGTYSNSNASAVLSETPQIVFNVSGHGFATGDVIYIRPLGGSLQADTVRAVDVIDANSFSINAYIPGTNSNQPCFVANVEDLTRFTEGTATRYSIRSIQITQPGTNYLTPEALEIVEDTVALESTGGGIRLRKQRGTYFEGQPEIFRTKVFTYTVKNAKFDGFYLFDEERREYLYVDRDTAPAGFTSAQEIELRRFDGVGVNNLLQFKFAQSPIYLRSYTSDVFSMGDSISGTVNNISASASELKLRSEAAIQNTRRPTPVTSEENIFGYNYNSFVGRDVVLWQRTVLRDQDYVLDPEDGTLGTGGITGDRLRIGVDRFVLRHLDPVANPEAQIRVPGLFIKVGAEYRRAFSTTDKPFFQEVTGSNGVQGVANPTISGVGESWTGQDFGALSAEAVINTSNPSTSAWYSYNTIVSQLAQRIHTNGKDGALYYHRSTAPQVTNVTVIKNNVATTIYAVPLFSL
jgi:hypothetical protein